ncbi:MAG TPA: DUF5658 family protein [Pyrinomonadaceae bacterium]|jgi:hypothetical protein|nr:DUF5658 family protein [Pyrinomonadaceae bacterium]
MGALTKSLILFALNWIDAQLTLIWVRSGLASEGNGLMNWLLKIGDAPFLLAKLAVGAFAAYVFYRCAHLPLARRGLEVALIIYCVLMLAHAATGISALGWQTPLAVITYLTNVPHTLVTLLS